MNPLKFLRKISSKSVDYTKGENYELGKALTSANPYAFYTSNDYENAYPSINRIAHEFMMIEPYVIDKNGKSVPSNVLDRLYHPNKEMSAADFREALAVMTCVHNKVHIRVHHTGNKGDRITPDTITGFTFLENSSEMIMGKKRWYSLPYGEVISSDEVITLKSINPYDISEGFSPTQSARKWITVDDYIASYQSGFFKNGAVPAGQFIITAATVQDFNDIVDNLQSKHSGPGKNNNVVYAHRPTDATGKPTEAQIEWIPYNTANKDLSMKDLFEQANKKIDSAYGVPASIRGVNDQNAYASVRVDEIIFMKYVVNPIAMKIWSKFTHELNRITGGMGLAITYDLELPQVADEEKVKAESRNIDFQIIRDGLAEGYSLQSIIDAFGLDNNYIKLQIQEVNVEEPTVSDDVDKEEMPTQDYELTKSKKISTELRDQYEGKVSEVVQTFTNKQIDKATQSVKAIGDATEQEVEEFVVLLSSVMYTLINIQGAAERNFALNLVLEAGLNTDTIAPFSLSLEQREAYRQYLKKVGTSYSQTLAEDIRKVLLRSREQGLTASQIKKQLQDLKLERWRIDRFTRTEINRAGGIASVDAMENIKSQTGYDIYKVWNVNPGACEFCRAYEGKRTKVDANFIDLDEEVHGLDGGVYKNNFTAAKDATLHPHCRCFVTYEVSSGVDQKAVDLAEAITKVESLRKEKEQKEKKLAEIEKKLASEAKEKEELATKLAETKDYSTKLEKLIDEQ